MDISSLLIVVLSLAIWIILVWRNRRQREILFQHKVRQAQDEISREITQAGGGQKWLDQLSGKPIEKEDWLNPGFDNPEEEK